MTPSELIKRQRTQHGLSQRELAYRAGTSQSAIARIEAGDEDITWKRLTSILAAMGDQPALDSRRLPSREAPDLELERAMSPEARLQSAINFNRFGSELAIAAAEARAKNAAA
ncbi:MAG TPA: helix-turn-helix domain-containing protein [Thermoleophilaceae bacterium]|jgi:transcriptional regulator with XRE-family HTH domain|nr:helix-turn-helix domain-containing protein [Thermoleophilaceae bacterium]